MRGSLIGPYRLEHELGAGGMGTVFRAVGPAGVAAVKIIHPHLAADADAMRRFRREAAIGISIRHRNVVATLDAGESDGRSWLAMEYVEGQTLRALCGELGRVPEDLCRHVGREVAAGLSAMHAARIIHRDLKPDNVLITRDHVVKVMDLGVARGAEDAASDSDHARMTQTGAFVGSLQYAAPEQFSGGGKGLDGRADLHALGVVLYEMAAGANPFADADWRVVFQRVLKETPCRLGAVNPQLSPFFEELVHVLLAKDRAQRFASAEEVVRVLDEGEAGEWWRARATQIRSATRRPLRRVKVPRETALVGRDAEMALLRSLFQRASEADGQVVLVEGEAGIGKSRLVDEFVALLEREGAELSFLCGGYPPGGAATSYGAFATAYREHFGGENLEASLGGALAETPLLVPGFAALLRGEAPPEGAPALTKDSLQTCFVHATRAIAAERVAVVLIDDLHFAPDEGRALFASLALAVPGHRVLFVGTSRPPLDEKWAANLTRLGRTTRATVGRLGPKDLATLLRDALKSAHLAEELSLRIAERTDGNPYFVFEVLRGLKDGKFLTQRPDGTWATTKVLREIAIPASVAELVQARLVDLSDDDRALLEVAACQGFEFDALLAGEVVGLARIPLMKTLGRIEKTHRLIRAAGTRYVFDHHQVQESLYAGLAPLVRGQYHAATGEALEARTGAAGKDAKDLDGALCVQLAEHFLAGGEGAKALRYLDPALTHLEGAYANETAIALARRALAERSLLVAAARATTCLRLAVRFEIVGRHDEERAALDEAVAAADASGDAALRSRSRCELGGHLSRAAKNAEADRALAEAVELARSVGDVRDECVATGEIGHVARRTGRLDDARAHFERSLALSELIGDRLLESRAVGAVGMIDSLQGRYEDARARLSRQSAMAADIGDRRAQAVVEGNLGVVARDQSRLDEAKAHFERHLTLARGLGDRRSEAVATGNLGVILHDAGRLGEARTCYERYFALARENGDARAEAHALLNLGWVALHQGRLDDARSHRESAFPLVRAAGNRMFEGYLLLARGTAAANEDDTAAAEAAYREAIAVLDPVGDSSGSADGRFRLGSVLARVGRTDEARALLERARDASAAIGARAVEVLASAHLAALPGGDVAAAEDVLERHHLRLNVRARMDARLALFRATGKRAHLAEAKRLLDEFLAKNPDERGPMLANVRLHREIEEAARAAGL